MGLAVCTELTLAFQTHPTIRSTSSSLLQTEHHRRRRFHHSSRHWRPLQARRTDRGQKSDDAPIAPKKLIRGADNYLRVTTTKKTGTLALDDSNKDETTRRLFFAGALMAGGAALNVLEQVHDDQMTANAKSVKAATGKLQWEVSPVNKRSGVTVFDAEKAGYNIKFVTYLSRFLLCFDSDCQRWWYSRASDLPRRGSAQEVNAMRLQQFAAFSASVEVGLQEYRSTHGPRDLMRSLLKRYCPDIDKLAQQRAAEGLAPMSDAAKARQVREIKEARRQIALLFGLMEQNQPVEEITRVLAAIDNGSVTKVDLVDPGSGYAYGYGAPLVTFPPPAAGRGYTTATGRATLVPNGKILRIDLVNRGFGYKSPPVVTISPPMALRTNPNNATLAPATAKAFTFRSGVNKGRLERIQVMTPGNGYTDKEIIRVFITPSDLDMADGGVTATATAVLEYKVGSIKVVDGGSGYAVEKPIAVEVEPPPLTARVNMNDPMMARVVTKYQPLPATTIPSREMRKNMPKADDPKSVENLVLQEASNGGKGGGGGCIGRACYDRPVVAMAYPVAEVDSYNAYQNQDEAAKATQIEEALEARSASSLTNNNHKSLVKGTSSGIDTALPALPAFGGGVSSSNQLLSLLPEGIGLQYDKRLKRYKLEAGSSLKEWTQSLSPSKPLDPEFGPRGRSPIEKEKVLGLDSYLRFGLSGAICCSAVHLALTPIDVVKTKMQTDPQKYPGILSSFQTVVAEEGGGTFFTGWAPTFAGYFVWGGFTYALTEFMRRYFMELSADVVTTDVEVLVILAAAGLSAMLGSFFLAPFEAVRIRSVAQPDYGPNAPAVAKRMVDVSTRFVVVVVVVVGC